MPSRTRKINKKYRQHRKTDHAAVECIFCELGPEHYHFVDETKSFKIVRNLFPYSQWDHQTVTDHLILIPKKHTETLGDLDKEETVEYMEIIGSYETTGYNIYARGHKASSKTVPHQHTHLIKTAKTVRKISIASKKPRFSIS